METMQNAKIGMHLGIFGEMIYVFWKVDVNRKTMEVH